jgi:hypothetical protein
MNIHLTSVSLSNILVFSLLIHTGHDVDNEGARILSEALKLNTSLTSLNLSGNLSVYFVLTHSIQVMKFAKKELSNYLKHSTQIRHLLHSISPVTPFASVQSHSIQITIKLEMQELANCLKHSNQILPSLHLDSMVIELLHHYSQSKTGNYIGNEGVFPLFEALKSNPSLTSIWLFRNSVFDPFSFTLRAENHIGLEGAIKLSEALKFNTSLTSLNLNGNSPFASFHSQLIQAMILEMKGLSTYLKHSNQIHPSLNFFSLVTDHSFIFHSPSDCR